MDPSSCGFPATNNNNTEIGEGVNEQYVKNVYDHLISSLDDNGSVGFEADPNSGYNYWSGLLKQSLADDNDSSHFNESNGNIQFEYGGNLELAVNELSYSNPSIQGIPATNDNNAEITRGANEQSVENVGFHVDPTSGDNSWPDIEMLKELLAVDGNNSSHFNESNGNLQFEYGGNPNLVVNELSYYNPSIQECNNNIQQFEYGGNPNPIPMDFECGDVDLPLDSFSGLLEDSPSVNSFNNIQIGEISSSSSSSNFNDETAAPSDIPAGYKFNPTDEELIVYFLGREVSRSGNHNTPEIKHANIYDYEPEDLLHFHKNTNDKNEKMYFYTPIKKIGESKTHRGVKSGNGYWRATQAPAPIRKNGHTIGTKTSLTYMRYTETNRTKGDKTRWLMYEYKLPRSQKSQQELVLVVIYYHKAKSQGEVV